MHAMNPADEKHEESALHPIKDLIIELVEGVGEDGLPEAERSRLCETLDLIAAQPTIEIMHAVATVFAVADFLEDQGAKQIAATLCELVDRKVIVEAMKAINKHVSEDLAEDVARTS